MPRKERERAFDSECWRVELGEQAAKCLKGENGSEGSRIIAGRAARGLREAWRLRFLETYGGTTAWGKGE